VKILAVVFICLCLLPSLSSAQLLPGSNAAQIDSAAFQEADRRHQVDYEFGSPVVLLGFGWDYKLDGKTVRFGELMPHFENEGWYGDYRWKRNFWSAMSIGLISLDILAFITGAASINHNGEYVLVGGAALVPLLWMSLFENSEVQNMMVDSYKEGRDIQVALMEQERLKARLQMSKKMNAVGVVMAVASAALITTGGIAALNGKNYGYYLLWGGVVTIPFDAVVMLVSHESYNSAVNRYRNP
jgi:uncharacterized membrane protein YuzA (DUF378 family)